MPDDTAIVGMISGFKGAMELIQLAINTRDAGVIKAKAIELQGQIFAAQTSALTAEADQFTLLERVRELEKEVADLKAWDAEKEKYQLVEVRRVAPGRNSAFAYVLKELVSSSGTKPYFCPHCYEDRLKSILQVEQRVPNLAEVLVCPRCGTEIFTQGDRDPRHASAKRSSGRPAD
jgi:hypothetical protein